MNFDRYKYLFLQLFDPSHGGWVPQAFGLILATIGAYLVPVKHFLILVGVLVVADMWTGWRAAKKTQGTRFNSKGMGGTIEKTALYMLAILLCRGVDLSFGMDGTIGTTYAIAGLIAGRELLSNLENIDKANGSNLATAIRERFGGLFGKKEDPEGQQ